MAYLAHTLVVGCGRLEVQDERGNTRSFQEMNTHRPFGVKEWSYGTDGWYRIITTLTVDGETTILAEGSWPTYGSDYVAPSRRYSLERQKAIEAIPEEVMARLRVAEKAEIRKREALRKQFGGFVNGRWVEPVA
jgi:hypothetical protein